ncbi:MAG: site-2 protease family protein [Candidatus Omnitrophota bacterium]|nr:MAG: site-2 protease family protein [Candidatus Omnitrophota bacterium]
MQANQLILSFFLNLPAFLIALVVHEYAHGFIAHKLGDDTAKKMGRLTMNPLAHIDFFGTILLPLFLIVTSSPVVFGWAKPVPVNFYKLRNPKRDMIWVGIAGPVANFITALFFFLVLKLQLITSIGFFNFCVKVVLINLVLGLFNLIPIPPLDGSRILTGLLPLKLAKQYMRFERYGIIVLLILLYLLGKIF